MDQAELQSAEDDIDALLGTYERSLNTSDARLAASCYAEDGLFMPTQAPTIQGAGLGPAYAQIFETIRLRVKFTVDELVIASPTIAYALTQSHGTQTVLATDVTTPEANREMFVFRRGADGWRIGRYMFNKSE